MAFFSGRRGALSASVAIVGIGQGLTPAAGKPEPKGDDDEAKKKEEDRQARNKAAGRDPDDDGDDDKPGDGDDDGDGEGDEEDAKKGSKACAPRRRERARIRTILAHPSAEGRVGMAVHLACNTAMRRDEAIALLERSPKEAAAAPAAPTLRQSMAPRDGVNAGSHAPVVTGQQAIDAQWDAIASQPGVVVTAR